MKKAQGEIITTVLIILLVLAAIIIVWQVVNSAVAKGGKEVDTQSSCIGLNLVIVSATNYSSGTGKVIVKRDPGAGTIEAITPVVFVNGLNNKTGTRDLKQLESDTIQISGLKQGDRVQVAGKTGNSLCSLGPEVIVTNGD